MVGLARAYVNSIATHIISPEWRVKGSPSVLSSAQGVSVPLGLADQTEVLSDVTPACNQEAEGVQASLQTFLFDKLSTNTEEIDLVSSQLAGREVRAVREGTLSVSSAAHSSFSQQMSAFTDAIAPASSQLAGGENPDLTSHVESTELPSSMPSTIEVLTLTEDEEVLWPLMDAKEVAQLTPAERAKYHKWSNSQLSVSDVKDARDEKKKKKMEKMKKKDDVPEVTFRMKSVYRPTLVDGGTKKRIMVGINIKPPGSKSSQRSGLLASYCKMEGSDGKLYLSLRFTPTDKVDMDSFPHSIMRPVHFLSRENKSSLFKGYKVSPATARNVMNPPQQLPRKLGEVVPFVDFYLQDVPGKGDDNQIFELVVTQASLDHLRAERQATMPALEFPPSDSEDGESMPISTADLDELDGLLQQRRDACVSAHCCSHSSVSPSTKVISLAELDRLGKAAKQKRLDTLECVHGINCEKTQKKCGMRHPEGWDPTEARKRRAEKERLSDLGKRTVVLPGKQGKTFVRPEVATSCNRCTHKGCVEPKCCNMHDGQKCKHNESVSEGKEMCLALSYQLAHSTKTKKRSQLADYCTPCYNQFCNKSDCGFVHPDQLCAHKVNVRAGHKCKAEVVFLKQKANYVEKQKQAIATATTLKPKQKGNASKVNVQKKREDTIAAIEILSSRRMAPPPPTAAAAAVAAPSLSAPSISSKPKKMQAQATASFFERPAAAAAVEPSDDDVEDDDDESDCDDEEESDPRAAKYQDKFDRD
jgi:hypothetical protein